MDFLRLLVEFVHMEHVSAMFLYRVNSVLRKLVRADRKPRIICAGEPATTKSIVIGGGLKVEPLI